MQTFLEKVAEDLLRQYEDRLHEMCVVFPNRRAIIFFRDALAKGVGRPALAPQMLTFEDFINELSVLQCADRLTLVHSLYDVFGQVTGIRESFDRFYHWGEMLLRDLDEIDRWQISAKDLFSNLQDIKELEAYFDYLTPEQIEVIARFWNSFSSAAGQSEFSSQDQFIRLWSRLDSVYQAYQQKLQKAGIGYAGMLTRQVAELAESYQLEPAYGQVIFVGFNAFSRAEEKIVRWFVKEHQAQMFWDLDALYTEDTQQEAGMFFRRYQADPVLGATIPKPLPSHFTQGNEKQMQIIATTLEVGQAKKLGETLGMLAGSKNFNPEKAVVVLPDEQLLFPVLHSIPDAIRRINVTMGYPLRKTPLYSLLEDCLHLQEEKKFNSSKNCYEYYHTSVLSILKHPYLVQYRPELSFQNVQEIVRNNKVYIQAEDLKGDHQLYTYIFRPVSDTAGMFEYLKTILSLISELVHEEGEQITDETTGEEIMLPNLEQELVYHFYIQLNRIQVIMQEHAGQLNMSAFARLFRQVLESVRVPFTGEPLRGLQVMGVLETRNLDFDHVFILSMNEGVYPPAETSSSFIPGSLRKGFGLPNQDQQDALYAYTFLRLLQKASHVYCFYNTEDTQQLSGEPSRLLYQLIYEAERREGGKLRFPARKGKLSITRHTLALPVHAIPAGRLVIEKSGEVLSSLRKYIGQESSADHRLTPSALNTYLDCRLKFYFRYVVGMKEAEVLQAEVDPAVFGNILHKTMEVLYRGYLDQRKNKWVDADVQEVLSGKPLQAAIAFAFREHFRVEEDQGFTFEGKNLIVREIITKMARRILELDARYAPFEILGLEHRNFFLELQLTTEEGKLWKVPLKGIIDRIDRKAGIVRVLDYKTGRDDKNIRDISSLFDRENPRRNKAAMQALFYALLYDANQQKGERVVPGLINAKNIFEEPFEPSFSLNRQPVNDFSQYELEYVAELRKVLAELFDEKVPFDQTTDQDKCGYCPYASICF